MINEIVSNIKSSCEQDGIPMPDIYTEFGTFTVGASGAHIFSVLGQKSQNTTRPSVFFFFTGEPHNIVLFV